MQHLENISDKSGYHAALLFMVWPLLAVVSAFSNFRKSWAKNIFWAFCAFYGFVFAIGAESESSDIVRYVAEYQTLHNEQLTVQSTVQYFQNSGEVDIMRTLIAVMMSRFTDSQAVLTLVYGFIFGFFLSRNLWFVLERLDGRILPLTILLLVCFFFINPIWKLNGFRFWTATHVFLYGLLPYLFHGKVQSLKWCFASLLFHFSFIVPVGILMGYLLAGNRRLVYTGFFLITLFLSEIDIEVFNSFIENYSPEIIQERSAGYRSEAQVEAFREGGDQTSNWYVNWYGRALRWSMAGYILVLFFTGKDFFEKNRNWLNLYCFSVVFYGVANLFSSLPSGGRFITLANLCAISLIILYVQNRPHDKWLKRFILISLPGLVLYVIVSIRIALYTLSATAVIGNPVLSFFIIGENVSLNDVMRMIL